jgi:hypothetical protein
MLRQLLEWLKRLLMQVENRAILSSNLLLASRPFHNAKVACQFMANKEQLQGASQHDNSISVFPLRGERAPLKRKMAHFLSPVSMLNYYGTAGRPQAGIS